MLDVRTPALEPYTLQFGIKSSEEVELDGVLGIITRGWASKYNVVDQDGEVQVPGSFNDVVDAWGRQKEPLVLYHHGGDPILKSAPIGRGLKFELTPEGLYAECFIPAEPTPPFRDNAAAKTARYRQVYQGLKSRLITGYSVGGMFRRMGKALVEWSMTELTITPRPCLREATFALGSKAVQALWADDLGEPPTLPPGRVDLPTWTATMDAAQAAGDQGLHDHLLGGYAPEHQGDHSGKDCAICTERRGDGGKASAPDGDFLVVDDAGQHLRVKRDGTPDHGLMGAAWAALHSDFRGHAYAGTHKDEAIATLTALYHREGQPLPGHGEKAAGDFLTLELPAAPDPPPLPTPDPAVLAEACATLATYTAGVKAGKRHSAATVAKFQQIIALLTDLLGNPPDDAAPEGGAKHHDGA